MLAEGRIIGDRYEIIGKVGSGGMADVYKAQDHRLNRFVAIKVLKQEYSADTTFVSKFRGEAQSAAGLSHPNIVNVYDVGEEAGLYYIVMELVEGITLKKFIERKGKLELKEAVGIAIQIAQGMEAAHDNHIIHRDIKPQNIIISREGKVKVTDFGIARAASSNTITTGAMGSVHYISPEQARGGYSDEKSDIYSLGVTIYEMLSGTMPFAAENTVSVALLHIQEEATPLRELDPSIPVSIERIVQKCMQKKPERRYLSASELIRDLKRSISNPDGEFVQMAAAVNDSPTIHISDEELGRIKNARFSGDTVSVSERGGQTSAGTKPSVLEEDGDELDPKMEKLMLFGGIAAIVILAIVIIFLVIKGFHLFEGKNELPNQDNQNPVEDVSKPGQQDNTTGDVTGDNTQGETVDTEQGKVPSLTGLKLEDAISLLEANEFNSYLFEYQFSDSFDKDIVMTQDPAAESMVPHTTEIKLIVSNGGKIVQVPDVYNRIQEEAETLLSDAGLVVKHDYAYSSEIESGRVIATNPERGMETREGAEVTIIISRGPEKNMTTVPDLIGKTESEARTLLEEAKLLGNVTYTHSDEVEEGLVITQDTSVGVSVEEGLTIGFSVSLGAEAPVYSYIGSTTIDALQLPDGAESAYVEIRMDQDGKTTVIAEGTFTADDFPMTIDGIVGSSLLDGTVYVIIDGVLDNEHIWWAHFNQVEN